MSKKQKIINFLVFASFAMQMIDMPLATLVNAVTRIGKPISGLIYDADPAWSMRYFQRFWDEPLKSKKQKVINFLIFASFATQIIDMPLATLANAVICIRKPISGLVVMRVLPGQCVTSRDAAVPVTL